MGVNRLLLLSMLTWGQGTNRLNIVQIIEDANNAQFQIQAYEAGHLKINHKLYQKSVIIASDLLVSDWPPQSIQALRAEHLIPIIDLKPDVFLLGTGSQLVFPELELLAPLYDAKIGTEVMNTYSACKTYQVLTAEERHVVAALMVL